MAPTERQPGASLKERLLGEFFRFSFFKAVHLLESLFPNKKPLGQVLTPSEEAVRFSVKPGFTFPPSDIADLKSSEDGAPVTMQVAFMGLIGPSGVLPHPYNELAVERARKKDFGLISFYDIFHHRLISLFYLAWKKVRFPENYLPGGRDRLSGYLLSLIGMGTAGLRDRVDLPAESLIFCSGHLSKPVSSAVAIEATAEYFSGEPARVEQFVNRSLPLDPEDQTQIGVANGRLGVDALCGSRIWECQTKFRVDLGPMGYSSFLRFLPTGDKLRPIFSLIRYMVGIEYEFEIGVILDREEVPRCELGMHAASPALLGWNTWVKSEGFTHRENQTVIFEESAARSFQAGATR